MRWRVSVLLLVAVLAPLLGALAVAEGMVRRVLHSTLSDLVPPGALVSVADALGRHFLALGIGAAAVAVVIALVMGWGLTASLRRLRLQILRRIRAERFSPLEPSPIAEVDALTRAVDRLSDELAERIQVATHDRNELAVLLNSFSEGIVRVGPRGRIVHANPAAYSLLGLPDDARGQPVSALVRNAELRGILERAARGQSLGTHEVALDERRLLVSVRPIPPEADREGSESNEEGGAVVTLADLTELRRLEGVRRDFVANASHELKTPLTSIRGYVETLMTDELPSSMQRQFLEVIEQNTQRLQRIVDDLLDLSRLESGGWRPELQWVSPLEVAMDAWTGLQQRAQEKDVEFRTSGEDRRVLADPGGLRQVFSNLFDNALRHTPAGGQLTVRVCPGVAPPRPPTRRREDPADAARPESAGWITIEVRDNGSGIPREALPRIFERFYRVDPARSRAEGGTGLGLSIVKHLMEAMGGDVDAESNLGKGTTIRLRLTAAA